MSIDLYSLRLENLKRPRVGRNMIEAVRFVVKHPGCAKADVAAALSELAAARGKLPADSSGGYATVNRAIAAGFIHATLCDQRGPRVYSLCTTPTGNQLIQKEEK